MKCCGAQPEFAQMRRLRSLSEAHIYFTLKDQVAVEILAKYAHNVLEIYKGKDIYIVTQCTRMMQFGLQCLLKRLQYAVEAYRFLFIFRSQLSNVVRLSVPFSIVFWNIWTWVRPRLVFSSLS